MKAPLSLCRHLPLLVALLSSQWTLVQGGKFLDTYVLGDDVPESPDSPDSPYLIALSVAGPVGVLLLAVGCYCGRHSIQRWWNARKKTAAAMETMVAEADNNSNNGKPEMWPFALVPDNSNHKVVCQEHQEELCTSGCQVDYSLLNQVRHRLDYAGLKGTAKRARLVVAESTMKDFITKAAAERDDSLVCTIPTTGTTNLTIPLQDSAALLLKDTDPRRIVTGFASICYAIQSQPDHYGTKVDKNCYQLALRAMEMVNMLQQRTTTTATPNTTTSSDQNAIVPPDKELASSGQPSTSLTCLPEVEPSDTEMEYETV